MTANREDYTALEPARAPPPRAADPCTAEKSIGKAVTNRRRDGYAPLVRAADPRKAENCSKGEIVGAGIGARPPREQLIPCKAENFRRR